MFSGIRSLLLGFTGSSDTNQDVNETVSSTEINNNSTILNDTNKSNQKEKTSLNNDATAILNAATTILTEQLVVPPRPSIEQLQASSHQLLPTLNEQQEIGFEHGIECNFEVKLIEDDTNNSKDKSSLGYSGDIDDDIDDDSWELLDYNDKQELKTSSLLQEAANIRKPNASLDGGASTSFTSNPNLSFENGNEVTALEESNDPLGGGDWTNLVTVSDADKTATGADASIESNDTGSNPEKKRNNNKKKKRNRKNRAIELVRGTTRVDDSEAFPELVSGVDVGFASSQLPTNYAEILKRGCKLDDNKQNSTLNHDVAKASTCKTDFEIISDDGGLESQLEIVGDKKTILEPSANPELCRAEDDNDESSNERSLSENSRCSSGNQTNQLKRLHYADYYDEIIPKHRHKKKVPLFISCKRRNILKLSKSTHSEVTETLNVNGRKNNYILDKPAQASKPTISIGSQKRKDAKLLARSMLLNENENDACESEPEDQGREQEVDEGSQEWRKQNSSKKSKKDRSKLIVSARKLAKETTSLMPPPPSSSMSQQPIASTSNAGGYDSSDVPEMDESWYVTPPPCFTGSKSHKMLQPKAKEDARENALIEHPSIYIAQNAMQQDRTLEASGSGSKVSNGLTNLNIDSNNKEAKASSASLSWSLWSNSFQDGDSLNDPNSPFEVDNSSESDDFDVMFDESIVVSKQQQQQPAVVVVVGQAGDPKLAVNMMNEHEHEHENENELDNENLVQADLVMLEPADDHKMSVNEEPSKASGKRPLTSVRPIKPERQPSWQLRRKRVNRRSLSGSSGSPSSELKKQKSTQASARPIGSTGSSNKTPTVEGSTAKPTSPSATSIIDRIGSSIFANLTNLASNFGPSSTCSLHSESRSPLDASNGVKSSLNNQHKMSVCLGHHQQQINRRPSSNQMSRKNQILKVSSASNKRPDRRTKMHKFMNGISVNRKVQTNYH